MPIKQRLFPSARAQSGFSLVEMIGVLAIIAILAVIIVPKVFSTIDSSRVTSTVGSVTSIKSSVTDFGGKYGTIPLTTANSRLDDLLFTAGLMEGRFVSKIGTAPSIPPIAGATWANTTGAWVATGGASQATQSRIICLTSNVTAPNTAVGANYQLDGSTNLPANSRVISAVLMGVTASQAQQLSTEIDGPVFTQTSTTTADAAGKVVYAAPTGAGVTNVYIYIAHQ